MVALQTLARLSMVLLVALPSAQCAHGGSTQTVTCYGNELMTTIGNSSGRMSDCPSCVKSSLCISGGFCFTLNTTAIHIFKDGILKQSILIDSRCVPVSLQETFATPGYILIQCQSFGARHLPAYQIIQQSDDTYSAGDFRVKTFSDNEYKGDFVVGEGLNKDRNKDNFFVSILRTPGNNQILIQDKYGSGSLKLTITDCDSVERLHSGPAHNRDTLQVVVDCRYNGNHTRQKLLLSSFYLTGFDEHVRRVHLHPPLANDTVIFSPDNKYILYQGMSRIQLVDNTEPSKTPGIIVLSGPIAETQFLDNDTVLISVPRLNRTLVNITEFFSSIFDQGEYILPSSEAYCPEGVCSPLVLDNDQLYLLAYNQHRPFYLNLMMYNLSNPTSQPHPLGKTLTSNSLDICFVNELTAQTASVPPPPSTTDGSIALTTSVPPPPSTTDGSIVLTTSVPPSPSTTADSTLMTSVPPTTNPTSQVITPTDVAGTHVSSIRHPAVMLILVIFAAAVVVITIRVVVGVCWINLCGRKGKYIIGKSQHQQETAESAGAESAGTASECISMSSISLGNSGSGKYTSQEVHAVSETNPHHIDLTNKSLQTTEQVK